MLCVRALVRALNDAKNYAQQGCVMQFNGITLRTFLLRPNVLKMNSINTDKIIHVKLRSILSN